MRSVQRLVSNCHSRQQWSASAPLTVRSFTWAPLLSLVEESLPQNIPQTHTHTKHYSPYCFTFGLNVHSFACAKLSLPQNIPQTRTVEIQLEGASIVMLQCSIATRWSSFNVYVDITLLAPLYTNKMLPSDFNIDYASLERFLHKAFHRHVCSSLPDANSLNLNTASLPM